MDSPINRSDSELDAILHRIKDNGRHIRNRRILTRRLGYAAAITILLVGGITVLLSNIITDDNAGTAHAIEVQEQEQEQIILRLADGETIVLDDHSKNAVLAANKQVNIATDEKNTVYYSSDGIEPEQQNAAPEINEISVPKKGFVRLVLSDGTAVTINSSSRLSFPQYFAGDDRKVRLRGEAYFEVAHDADKPFIVETDRMTATVLGTTFNIQAYDDESYVQATLVSGSIAVSANSTAFVLNPGEQAYLNEGMLKARNVDVGFYTSWIHGKFMFNNATLEEIFKQVVRWYDVDILFASEDLKKIRFTGSITRHKSIDALLRLIEITSPINITLNGDRYVINSK